MTAQGADRTQDRQRRSVSRDGGTVIGHWAGFCVRKAQRGSRTKSTAHVKSHPSQSGYLGSFRTGVGAMIGAQGQQRSERADEKQRTGSSAAAAQQQHESGGETGDLLLHRFGGRPADTPATVLPAKTAAAWHC